jgi:hypothetical protein
MERYKGVEALKKYSFRDVVLKPDRALTSLNERVKSLIPGNIRNLLSDFNPDNPKDLPFINILKQAQKLSPEKFFPPGGLSMSNEEFLSVYQKFGNPPFTLVLEKYMKEIFPHLLENENPSRNPGPTCVGYILDLFQVLNPEFATFEDGARSMMEIMRNKTKSTRIDPYMLGAMIDDSINLRGINDSTPDILVDVNASMKLKDVYLQFADEKEKEEFKKGFTTTYEELKCKDMGISLN